MINKKSSMKYMLFFAVFALMMPVVLADVSFNTDNYSPVDDYNTTNPTPLFTFNATSDAGPTSDCTLFIGNIEYNSSTVPNGIEITMIPNTALAEGDHTWYVNCTDADGVFKSDEMTLTVDQSAPNDYNQADFDSILGYGQIVTDLDGFLSTATGNNILNITINITDNFTAVANVTFDFTQLCTGITVTKTARAADGLWHANCTVTENANFAMKTINISAKDILGQQITSLYRLVMLYNFTTPPDVPGVMQFGDDTTDLSEETNLADVNYVIDIRLNGSLLPGAPWADFRKAALLDFTSLNMTSDDIGSKLQSLSTAIDISIAPPGEFGTNSISVDTAAFAELDTDTEIILYNLPFKWTDKSQADVVNDTGGNGGITIDDWEGDGITGNLTFTVTGFSGYDILDSEIPTVSIDSPDNLDIFNASSGTNMFISVTANGTGTEISNVKIFIDDIQNSWKVEPADFNCTEAEAGSELFYCNFTKDIGPGSHTIIAVAYDYGGDDPGNNATSSAVTIAIDNSAPSITINSPTSGGYNNGNIDFTVADTYSPTSDCTAYINGIENGTNSSVLNNTATIISLDLSLGTYTLNINCTDEVGNMGSSAPLNFTIDLVAPTVSLISPANGITWNSSTNPEFHFNVTDSLSSTFTCRLYQNGSTNNASIGGMSADNSSIDGDIYSLGWGGVMNGNLSWHVECTDEAGNTNDSETRWFLTNDTTAPVISGQSPSGTISTSSATLSVTTDESASCRYSTSNIAYVNMTSNFTDGTTSHTSVVSGLSTGSHTYYVRCSDVNDNIDNTSAVISFTKRSGSGGSSSGGGSGSTVTPNPSTSQTWARITPGGTQIMKIVSNDFGVKEISIAVNNPANNVRISIEKLSGKPASVTKDITGKVFMYLEIKKTNLNDSDINGTVKIKFQVNQTWLSANKIEAKNMVLKRFADNNWQDLKTTLLSTDAVYAYYEAESPGFSIFAIAESSAIVPSAPVPETPETPVTPPVETPTEQPPVEPPVSPGAEVEPEPQKKPGNIAIFALILIVVLAVVIGVIAISKGKGKGRSKIKTLEEK